MAAILQSKPYQHLPEAMTWLEATDEADYYAIRIPLVSQEGHERLTRLAAAGLPGLTAGDRAVLAKGVRRVDIGVRTHISSSHQRRHVLRRSLCQPLREALRDARRQLLRLYARAASARSRREAFGWIGEALHLIQDSYSPAHTQRRRGRPGGPHPIVYIRNFGQGRAPLEHAKPSDARDRVPTGPLNFWAREAVRASRQYLQLVRRHRRGRLSRRRRRRELRAFMNRHFLLSRRRREPNSIYRRCRYWPWRP